MSDLEAIPHTQERTTGDGCTCCYSTAAASIAIAEAVAEATAQASATASAFALAAVRVAVIVEITIAIGIFVAAIAVALALAKAVAIAIAVAVAIALAIAIAIAIAIAFSAARALQPSRLHRCLVLLDIPATASLTSALKPAVMWETVYRDGADHIEILGSIDGGLNFAAVSIGAGRQATNLPLTGSFVWDNVTLERVPIR